MKTVNYLFVNLLLLAALVSCNKDNLLTGDDPVNQAVNSTASAAKNVGLCGSQTYPLLAGDINVGSLTLGNDGSSLVVTYISTVGKFGNLHVWVGTDMSLLPKSVGGNPVPEQFPMPDESNLGVSVVVMMPPLTFIPGFNKCGDNIYVVAHAEVIFDSDGDGEFETVTAYGGDQSGTGTEGGWYYAKYKVACCDTPIPPSNLGTAFAKGGWVFTIDPKSNPDHLGSLSLTKNRWGWAINLKSTGQTTYPIYVGAGLNQTSKGLLVGTATINWGGNNASIKYDLKDGYSLEEVHVYTGDMEPTTIAPGQYGFNKYFNPLQNDFDVTLPVSDTGTDGVWFILHAIVWGPKVINI